MTREAERRRGEAAARGESMRKKAMDAAKKRKEEFLGARVPKALRDKVIQRAEDVGVPVSILIRQILEAAFKDELPAAPVVNAAPASAPPPSIAERFEHVLGWEQIQLNKQVNCSGCGVALAAGGRATLGFSATGGAPAVLCGKCKGSI